MPTFAALVKSRMTSISYDWFQFGVILSDAFNSVLIGSGRTSSFTRYVTYEIAPSLGTQANRGEAARKRQCLKQNQFSTLYRTAATSMLYYLLGANFGEISLDTSLVGA